MNCLKFSWKIVLSLIFHPLGGLVSAERIDCLMANIDCFLVIHSQTHFMCRSSWLLSHAFICRLHCQCNDEAFIVFEK